MDIICLTIENINFKKNENVQTLGRKVRARKTITVKTNTKIKDIKT
jgi:hypothetical protein